MPAIGAVPPMASLPVRRLRFHLTLNDAFEIVATAGVTITVRSSPTVFPATSLTLTCAV